MEPIGKSVIVLEKYFKLFFKSALKQYNLNATEGVVLLLQLLLLGLLRTKVILTAKQFSKSRPQLKVIQTMLLLQFLAV